MYIMVLYTILGGHLTYVNESTPFDDFETCNNVAMVTSEDVGFIARCEPVRK